MRPTPERVKEGIFSALQFDIEGRRVLDLFAGSGQLGLEALSRGAEGCTFVDASEESLNLVRKNIESTAFSDKAKAVRSDYAAFAAACRDTFDIVFLDPPYSAGLLMPAICFTMLELKYIFCVAVVKNRVSTCGFSFLLVSAI